MMSDGSQSYDNKRLHAALALFVLVATLIVYVITVAPTLSFWDCGEFVACSYILGIPHPPGAPLYILIGRIFSLLPIASDIAERVNLFSSVSSAFAAMFAFLCTFRLVKMWWPHQEFHGWKVIAAYVGSFVGTAMFAFSHTNWNNAVEAEVYGPAMLLMTLILWLVLRWADNHEARRSDAYLILIAYLGLLAIGIHLTVFLIMPVVFLAVILISPRLRRDVRFYITGVTLFSIVQSLDLFLISNGVWLAIIIAAAIVRKTYGWYLAAGLVFAGLVGFSCHLSIPIRSALEPSINQNNPQTWDNFNRYFERKQYGEEPMLLRALHRRASWMNQLGNHPRMGFWGFFSEQYGLNGRPFAALFVLGALGLFELSRRRPKIGLPFLALILICTLGLVFYMNFADGSHIDPLTGEGHLEVRDRDYFFTAGFILFGMAIGMGVSGLIEMARESTVKSLRGLRTPLLVLTSCLLFLMVSPLAANYRTVDRSGNYIPYDYARNLLSSCDENALLFTLGDNDTFPIWCLQEVYGYRTDIDNINLSLANMPWYIFQMRDSMGVPIAWTDREIRALRARVTEDGKVYRIQDRVIEEILTQNRGQRPIYFAVTVGEDARVYRGHSLENFLVMEGMVYRLQSERRQGWINVDRSRDLYWNVYKYRGLDDDAVYKDQNTQRLTGNYASGILYIADTLRKAGEFDEALKQVRKALEVVPYEYSTYNYMAQLCAEAGYDSLVPSVASGLDSVHAREMYYNWAFAKKILGDTEGAKKAYPIVLKKYPDHKDAFRDFVTILYQEHEYDSIVTYAEAWLEHNPNDQEVQDLLQQMSRPMVPRSPGTPLQPNGSGN